MFYNFGSEEIPEGFKTDVLKAIQVFMDSLTEAKKLHAVEKVSILSSYNEGIAILVNDNYPDSCEAFKKSGLNK